MIVKKASLLSNEERYRIHMASLTILERTGIDVHEEESVELLKKGGAYADSGKHIRIPSYMVKNALQSVPERLIIYSRSGAPYLFLDLNQVYFGTGADCPVFRDSITKEFRDFGIQDIIDASIICDFLPNIDFVQPYGVPKDVPTETSDIHQFKAMVVNTKKPLMFVGHNCENLKIILEMAKLIKNGEQELRQQPFFVLLLAVTSPLTFSKNMLEQMLTIAEKRLPVCPASMILSGGTGPATIAGMIAQGNAENLAALVIHQLKAPGAPFIYGQILTTMDMSSNIAVYGAPELYLTNNAVADMANFYRLPSFSTGGCTDSKEMDVQAGLEAGLSLYTSAIAGANLIHDVGYLASGRVNSYDYLIFCDEVIGMVKRIIRRIDLSDDKFSLDLIHKVKPGGGFIEEEHTLRHFREEHWLPKISNRQSLSQWKIDPSPIQERINRKIYEILKSHQPELLDPKVVDRMNEIISTKEA